MQLLIHAGWIAAVRSYISRLPALIQCSDNDYCPGANTTRAGRVIMLVRAYLLLANLYVLAWLVGLTIACLHALGRHQSLYIHMCTIRHMYALHDVCITVCACVACMLHTLDLH